MHSTNADLMLRARQTLKGNWGGAIAVSLVVFLISIISNAIPVIGTIASIVITGPLTVGLCRFFLDFVRGKEIKVAVVFEGFDIFLSSFLAYFLMIIFIVLWALLLIVPGIIAAISYSLTFFILSDNPEMDALEAIQKSKEMMKGNKYRMFCLGCRFIGWFLLGILTMGIGFIWIFPYYQTSFTMFYEELAGKNQSSAADTGYSGYTVNGNNA